MIVRILVLPTLSASTSTLGPYHGNEKVKDVRVEAKNIIDQAVRSKTFINLIWIFILFTFFKHFRPKTLILFFSCYSESLKLWSVLNLCRFFLLRIQSQWW